MFKPACIGNGVKESGAVPGVGIRQTGDRGELIHA